MRLLGPALLAFACLTAQSALAQDSTAPDAAAATTEANGTEKGDEKAEEKVEKKKVKKEREICRRISNMGSRRPEKVCLTKQGWRDFKAQNGRSR